MMIDNIIEAQQAFDLAQVACKGVDPNPRPKLCQDPATGKYMISYYFSDEYIKKIQGMEVISA